MKKMKLSNSKNFTIVDNEYFPLLSRWRWSEGKSERGGYALRKIGRSGKIITIQLHSLIAKIEFWFIPDDYEVDHINQNKLDNRVSNLRLVTHSENCINRKLLKTNFSSRFRGVSRAFKSDRFIATIKKNQKNLHLGSFANEEEAALAYNKAAKKIHGKFAQLNLV